MKLELEIGVKKTGDGFEVVSSGIAKVNDAVEHLDKHGHGHGPFDFLTHGLDEVGQSMLKAISIERLFEKALEGIGESIAFVKESIGHADFVRDLDLSLTAYVGNVDTAARVIHEFNEEQKDTRNTAEELQQTFRNLNPLANVRGFSVDAQAQITVMLSQIATVSNKTFAEIESGYQRVLTGTAGNVSRNALLRVLGITSSQLQNMGWDEFLGKIRQVAGKVDEFGQTWESTMHKAKEELMVSFAEGFNQAHGSAVDGMDAISAAVRDPAVKEALHELGVLTAEWAGKLGGVLTEIRGISKALKDLSGGTTFRTAIGRATLGMSELIIRGTELLGDTGKAALSAEQADARAAASAAAGRQVLIDAGILAAAANTAKFDALLTPHAVGGNQQQFAMPLSLYRDQQAGSLPAPMVAKDIGAFKSLGDLQRLIGDLATDNKLNTEAMKQFAHLLAENKAAAAAAGRPFAAADVNAALAGIHLEGTPTGQVAGKVNTEAMAIATRTEQMLAQARVIDLQNQKLAVQIDLDKEEQRLGAKKTGLENLQLDSATKAIIAQHEINALRAVELDKQIQITQAQSDYRATLSDINRKAKEENAKPGGPEIPNAVFDAERAAAAKKYEAQLDEINAKQIKGQADVAVGQKRLVNDSLAIVLARTEELRKVEGLVAAQKEEDNVLTATLIKSQQQVRIAELELDLQNQHVAFGALRLDQRTSELLKLHETVVMQEIANDSEIAMQQERKRYAKDQIDLAKEFLDVYTTGYTGEGVNPAIDQLTLLSAQQRTGFELHIAQIRTDGHAKEIAAIKSEADLRNQAIDQATQGYIGMANVMATATHDIFASLLDGKGMQDMLGNLVSGYRSLLGGALEGMVQKYITSWQQIAQGHIDPATGQMGHVDPATGKMVPTSPGQQQTAQNVMLGAQGAMALYSSYQNAQAGASKAANAVSGAMQGATIFAGAGPYGMVAGAIIGAAYGAVFSAIAEGSKARFQLTVGTDGKISVSGFGNATSANVDSAMRTINQTVTQAAAAVRGIIDAFPIAIASSLEGLGNLPAGTLGTQVERTRTFAISIFKKSFKGGYTADQLQHFMTEELPKILLEDALPTINLGLQDLGVNMAKIASLGITMAEDPTKAFQFIHDYIAGFVALRDSIDFLGKTTEQKTAIAAGKSPIDQMADANAQIAYLSKGFDQLTNADQVARLQQINAAIAQRYQLELQELNEIANARKAQAKSYADTERGFAMAVADPQKQIAILEAQRASVALGLNDQLNRHTRTIVAGAKTPAEVMAIADSYANLTTQIYNAAKSLRDSFQTILDSFKALDDQKAADAMAALNPGAQFAAIADKAKGLSSGFADLSDADKLKNSQDLIRLATQYYNLQKQALTDLGNAAKTIHESVAAQIFGIKFDQQKNNPQAQLEMLLAEQRRLYTSLSSATTAAEVNAIMAQIQSNVSAISGLEGNTPQAAADAVNALTAAETAAQAQIALLQAQAIANDAAITAAIKGVTTAVDATVAALNTLMTQATADLIAFGALIQAKLDTFVDAMKTSDAALLLTLQPVFDALGAAASDVGADLNDIAGPDGSLPRFRGGLDDATNALMRFASSPTFGQGSFASPTSTMSFAPTSFTPTISVDISGNMAPFVSLIQVVANAEIDKRKMQEARFAPRSGGL